MLKKLLVVLTTAWNKGWSLIWRSNDSNLEDETHNLHLRESLFLEKSGPLDFNGTMVHRLSRLMDGLVVSIRSSFKIPSLPLKSSISIPPLFAARFSCIPSFLSKRNSKTLNPLASFSRSQGRRKANTVWSPVIQSR